MTNHDPSDDASAMTDDRTMIKGHSAVAFVLATLLLLAGTSSTCARIIPVGAHRALKLPSQAALVARDGDTIAIDTGIYHDCAIWRAAHLTIEGRGPNVEIADTICADRGLFIVEGANATIRNLTFSGARGHGHNAAGILGLGDNLTVENARFMNNENGILLGGGTTSRVRISGSTFQGNGSCEGACAHGVYAGTRIARLEIAYCRFVNTRIAHHVKSRALNTIIENTDIDDGDAGTSSYLIDIPNGGDILIMHNMLQKGPKSSNPGVAISIGEEAGRNPTTRLIVRDNRFASMLSESTIFVRNDTGVGAELTGNTFTGRIVVLEGAGSTH